MLVFDTIYNWLLRQIYKTYMETLDSGNLVTIHVRASHEIVSETIFVHNSCIVLLDNNVGNTPEK